MYADGQVADNVVFQPRLQSGVIVFELLGFVMLVNLTLGIVQEFVIKRSLVQERLPPFAVTAC